jgi:PAS domain S-box-containing protein
MLISSSLIESIHLEQAIIAHPLVVSPETLATEAIALMSHARSSCVLEDTESSTYELWAEARSSCVLVMAGERLVGIFTERDVVNLSAEGQKIAGLAIAQVMTSAVVTIDQSALNDIFSVLNLFQRHRIRHLPIVDDHGKLTGLVTHESLRQVIHPSDLLRLRIISEVMTMRIVKAFPQINVLDITRLMAKEKVSSVVIVEEKNSLFFPIGIVTERDIVQFQSLELNLELMAVATVMSAPVFSITANESLWSALTLMQERRISRVVVTSEQGELQGIITQTTLLQTLNPYDIYKVVDSLKQKVSQLETEKLELLQNRNVQLEQEIQKRTQELQVRADLEELLGIITSRIRASLDLQDTLNTISSEVRKYLKCDRVIVYQFQQHNQGIVIADNVGEEWQSLVGHNINDCCFQETWLQPYLNGRIRVVHDVSKENLTDCHRQLLQNLDIQAKILVPIILGNRVWGLMLACQSSPRNWFIEEIELLQKLSVHVAIAIQQAQLYHRAQLELQERQRAEIALAESEALYRTTLNNIGDAVFITDYAGKFTFIGPNVHIIFGYSVDEILSMGTIERLIGQVIVSSTQPTLSNEITNIEKDIYDKYGKIHTILINIKKVDIAGGNWLYSCRDISDRKHIEKELQISEERLRTIVETSSSGLVAVDRQGIIVFVNPAAAQMFGRNIDELCGWPLGIPCDYKSRREEEIELLQPSGKRRTVSMQTAKIYWQGQEAFLISLSDITTLKDTEALLRNSQEQLRQLNEQLEGRVEQRTAALRESEQRYRALMDGASDAIILTDIHGNLLEVNRQAEELLGYSKDELTSLHYTHIYPIEERERASTTFSTMVTQQKNSQLLDTKVLRKDQSQIPIDMTGSVIQSNSGLIVQSIFRDITEQKQVEEALRRSEERFRRYFEQSLVGMAITSPEQEWLEVNDRLCEMLGYSRTELMSCKWTELTYADDLVKELTKLNRIVTGESEGYSLDKRFIRKDGQIVYVIVSLRCVRKPDGSVDYFAKLVQDITDRQHMEDALRRSEERFRIALNNSPIVVFNQDLDLRYTWIYNPALGFRPEEVVGKFDTDLFHREDAYKLELLKRRVLSTGQGLREEVIVNIQDDFICYVLTIDPLLDRHGNIEGITCAALDITDRKKTELALKESQYLIQRLTEASPDILYIYDLQENINVYTNLVIGRLLGFSPDDIHAMGDQLFAQLAHPDDLPRIAAHHERFNSGNDSHIWEIEYRMRDSPR